MREADITYDDGMNIAQFGLLVANLPHDLFAMLLMPAGTAHISG